MTMHEALHPEDDIDRLYVKKDEDVLACIDTTIRILHKTAWKKTDYSDQKQYRQHNQQRKRNNQKIIMERKTNVLNL